MNTIRFFAALMTAKIAALALKITHHNGTQLPGSLAIKICPDFLGRVAHPRTIVAVTGTNGKTTVANLIVDGMEASGRRVLSNKLGSNLHTGVASALAAGVTIFNKQRFSMAVLECDERATPRIFPYLTPDLLVVTNLFRDSVQRNAHSDYIFWILEHALPPSTKLLLNADDVISSRLGLAAGNERVFFGIDRMPTDRTHSHDIVNDGRTCPQCRHLLTYEYVRYHHIGRAHCEYCGWHSPDYDYAGTNVDIDHMHLDVRESAAVASLASPAAPLPESAVSTPPSSAGDVTVPTAPTLPTSADTPEAAGSAPAATTQHTHEQSLAHLRILNSGIHNIYNVVTAYAALRECGVQHDDAERIMRDIQITKTRYSIEPVGDVYAGNQMAKDVNGVANSRAFDYLASLPGRKELILMMGDLRDVKDFSENPCWMYDADFEYLNTPEITHIVVTGARGKDYRVRLLLAGIPDERISYAAREIDAPRQLHFEPGESIYVLHGVDSVPLATRVLQDVKKLALAAAERRTHSHAAASHTSATKEQR
ncbi:MAG: MurT ligase domain-containing protein [Arcanobacterium sp.]|nr:MurT ligase domain-containing protein [Arcanobacterium sp.]